MSKLAKVLLSEIDQPKLPIRISMDETKMQDLCESMREIGLLQPIGLKTVDGRYEIEFGHRRFIAASRLKWREISAIVFSAKELAVGAAMLAENVEREDITAAEEAVLFAQAMERDKLDEAGLMKRFRRSANYIADRLALLRGDPEIYRAVQERQISFAVGRTLNKCTDEPHRRYLLDAAIRSGASAVCVMGWIDQWRAQATQPQGTVPVFDTTAAPDPILDHEISCRLCGGYRDPYNLVSIYVHKWELEEILRVMQRPVDERPASAPSEAVES